MEKVSLYAMQIGVIEGLRKQGFSKLAILDLHVNQPLAWFIEYRESYKLASMLDHHLTRDELVDALLKGYTKKPEDRSDCGSGGCVTCPFSYNDKSDYAQNTGCLPSSYEIIEMKRSTGHNWSCHGDSTVLCGGFVKRVREKHPDLNLSEGSLISFDEWSEEGQDSAVAKADERLFVL